jgi:predicted ABC-type transport system involved in lysophospholipase L1 biosynthesis ATPase subunit
MYQSIENYTCFWIDARETSYILFLLAGICPTRSSSIILDGRPSKNLGCETEHVIDCRGTSTGFVVTSLLLMESYITLSAKSADASKFFLHTSTVNS